MIWRFLVQFLAVVISVALVKVSGWAIQLGLYPTLPLINELLVSGLIGMVFAASVFWVGFRITRQKPSDKR